MLVLRLDKNKVLTITKTSCNYTGENNFEKIRIVADKTISEKNLAELHTELYIYNIIDENWFTFNDCIPCEFVEDGDNLIFEIPVKGQYTVFPQLGMYLRFYNESGIVGKTNEVKTMILHHRDRSIDFSNSIALFDQYKNELSKITAQAENTNRIYFKKNCPNWTHPRIYVFNNEYDDGVPGINRSSRIWDFNESPYMIQDDSEEDLYYYDIPLAKYKKIIFFCDEKYYTGHNYKTSDLIIPASIQYQSLCYYQSEIGYDGI